MLTARRCMLKLEPALHEVMRNTWYLGLDDHARNSVDAWVQGGIHGAHLGLTDYCKQWITNKLADSGPASIYRFPAFWQSGDHPPDHNHGGTGMIALQEILQCREACEPAQPYRM